jgi:ribonuclease J
VAVVDSRSGAPAAAPQIVSRGWTHPPEAGELLEEAAASVSSSLAEAAEQGRPEPDVLRSLVRSAVGRVVSGRTRRRPMIVPVVVEA